MMLVGITAQSTLLVDDTLSVLIAEFHLIYRVTFSFLCSLTEIQRNQILRSDAGQRVTHLEEEINLLVGVRLQVRFQTWTTVISRLVYRHLCPSGINPDEFPVKLQLIRECFSWLDCIIHCTTLCAGCHSSCQKEKAKNQFPYHVLPSLRARSLLRSLIFLASSGFCFFISSNFCLSSGIACMSHVSSNSKLAFISHTFGK